MNGQLLLLLISMLLQNPGGEVLPGPNRIGSQGFPLGMPANAPILPTEVPAPNCTVGWGMDKGDGKFCMIIQIAPEAIVAFAQGPQGQELTADIPDGIRNRIEKVIVRIGSGQVERVPPNPQSFSDSRSNGNLPHIANLDTRSPVTIDRSPALFNASGGPGLPNGNGQLNPGSMVNNGQQNIEPGAYPTNNPSNYGDRSKPVGTFAGNGSNTGGFTGSPGYDIGNPNIGSLPTSGRNDLLPSTSSSSRDGFQPTQTKPLDFLQNRSNSGAAGIPSSSYPAPQANYASQPYSNQGYANSNQGYANSNQGYQNQGNVPSGTNRPYTPVAQNTNPAHNYNENYATQAPYTNPNGSLYSNPNSTPSIAQSQQYGAPLQQQASPYATTNPYPAGAGTSFASMPVPISRPMPSNLQTNDNVINDDQSIPKDTVLPLMLLFSIICNVYLGLWMSKLRDSYKQLVSDRRGIPISDLSN